MGTLLALHQVGEMSVMLTTAEDRHWPLLTFGTSCVFAMAGLVAAHVHARNQVRRANQVKDDFLATVSHELRTPLNAIIGWLQVLKSGTVRPELRMRALEAIDRNAHLQARLVGELLDASRLFHGKLRLSATAVDLREAVRTALDRVTAAALEQGVHVEAYLPDAPIVVSGDALRLQEIAWHLLANALKFTAAGGRVRVDLDVDEHQARLRVSDTGEGIAPEDLPRVFEPFLQGRTQSKRSGLGLGLAIARELVVLHGGTVSAESAGRGQGAVFLVRIPRINSQSGSPETTGR